MLTGWDVTALRFGVGALIAVFFLPRVTLPPLKVIALFSIFGGIGYATAVYAGFRLAPAAHASVLLPGALPFETAVIAWLWLGMKPTRPQRIALSLVFVGILLTAADTFSQGPRMTGLQLLGDLLFPHRLVVVGGVLAAPAPASDAAAGGDGGHHAGQRAGVYLPVWWLLLPSTMDQAPMAEIAMQAVYQGVLVVFVAMILYTFAVRQLGPQTVALLMAFVPGLSAVAAVPILGEPLSLLTLAGLGAVTLGQCWARAWRAEGGLIVGITIPAVLEESQPRPASACNFRPSAPMTLRMVSKPGLRSPESAL
ncbi:MAG: DMT family transporter [Rhodocyclaceae bacterium]|nr:DMT family transporter [Rhodocyclaceae bacterium]